MFDILVLANPVYVSLFWAVVLNLNNRKEGAPQRFLGKLMICTLVVYLSHMFYFLKLTNLYIWLDTFYYPASLGCFPMYYIYVLLLTRDRSFSLKLHGKYLIIPVFFFVLVATGYIMMNDETQEKYASYVQYGLPADGFGLKYMQVTEFLFRMAFIAQVVAYIVLTSRIIARHNIDLNNNYSELEGRRLRWVHVFNITFVLAALSSSTLAVIGRKGFEENHMWLLVPSSIFTLLIFAIGLLGNRQIAVHAAGSGHLPVTVADEKVPDRLKDDLISLFEKKKFYLNKDLNIWDVSGHLATNRTYISRIINQEFGQNFCAFVNGYRVEYAKKLLQSKKNLTVEEIADMSGFGSVNSLYRAFMAIENKSLAAYRNSLKNSDTLNHQEDQS